MGAYIGWDFNIADVDGHLIYEGCNYKTKQDAEDAAMRYINENNIVYYLLDVYQTESFWR